MTPFAEAIRAARQARGLRLLDVAHVLGASVPYVSDVEHGRREPFAPERIAQLAALLELDAARLRALAAHARGAIDVSGLSARQVARVLRLVERIRAGA